MYPAEKKQETQRRRAEVYHDRVHESRSDPSEQTINDKMVRHLHKEHARAVREEH